MTGVEENFQKGALIQGAPAETVDGGVIDLVGLGLAGVGKQACDLASSVVLLGDDELQGWSLRGS